MDNAVSTLKDCTVYGNVFGAGYSVQTPTVKVLNNGGFFKNIITLVPQLYITDEEIEMSIDLLDQLLSRLTK